MNFKLINLKLVVLFNALYSFLCLWNFIVKKNSSILLLTFGRKTALLTHCKPVIDRPFAVTTFLYSRWKYNTKRFTKYLNMLHKNIKGSSVSSVDIKSVVKTINLWYQFTVTHQGQVSFQKYSFPERL